MNHQGHQRGRPRKYRPAEELETDEPERLRLQTPEAMVPLLQPARYKGLYGGRGGAKSHWAGGYVLANHVANPDECTICLREFQKSLKHSVKKLLEDKIRDFEIGDYFDIRETEIRSTRGSGVIVFQGMSDLTADSIKSYEGFKRAWFEEAQVCSQRSLDLLRPTIRAVGAEMLFTWNPHLETDPVHQFFLGEAGPPPDSICVKVGYMDNPWCTPAIFADAAQDLRLNKEKYDWVWGGETLQHAEKRYFKNWRVEDFETPADAQHRFGLDWGFSPHPLAAVRCFIVGNKLYIDQEVYAFDCTVNRTPRELLRMEGIERAQIVAGRDRPERIRDLNDRGFRVIPALAGHNSVQRGLDWMETYEMIVHPRCTNMRNEMELFSHPVDKLTGKVLPGYVDENNHLIEAVRYANEDLIRLLRRRDYNNVIELPSGAVEHWSKMGRGR